MTSTNHENCPIFYGIFAGKEITAKSYRRLYYEEGYEKYSAIIGYMATAHYGSISGDLLLRSALSLVEICVHYHLEVHFSERLLYSGSTPTSLTTPFIETAQLLLSGCAVFCRPSAVVLCYL